MPIELPEDLYNQLETPGGRETLESRVRFLNKKEQEILSIYNDPNLSVEEKIQKLTEIKNDLLMRRNVMLSSIQVLKKDIQEKGWDNLSPAERDQYRLDTWFAEKLLEMARWVDELIKKLEEGDTMAEEQTSNAGQVIVGLIQGVYDIMGAIVNALKAYAADIAEILIGGVLALTVVRYGQRIFRGLTRWVGSLV